MKKNVLNHDFNYGTSTDNNDSKIKKLTLKNINDVKLYVEDLISSQMFNTKIKNNIISKDGFKNIKLIIELK